MEGLTSMRNLYLPDGSWAGQFMDEVTAVNWAKKQGHKLKDCEISTRKVVREDSRHKYPTISTEDYEMAEDLTGTTKSSPEEEPWDAPQRKKPYSATDVSGDEIKNDTHLMQFIKVADIKTIKKILL